MSPQSFVKTAPAYRFELIKLILLKVHPFGNTESAAVRRQRST